MYLKIKTLDELILEVKKIKRENKTVVFTNGCFDILHIGHIKLLEFAARQGDVLIVALNSDASVRKLKGSKRPIVPQGERSEIIAALACVSYVVLFEEETPCETIEKLKPDIHVKGGDYDMEKIPEALILKSYGAKTVKFEFIKGHSSTGIVERVIAAYCMQKSEK